jgi:hypothetical protein
VRYLQLEPHAPNRDYFSDDYLAQLGYDPQDPQRKIKRTLSACGFDNLEENAFGQLSGYNKYFIRGEKNAVSSK